MSQGGKQSARGNKPTQPGCKNSSLTALPPPAPSLVKEGSPLRLALQERSSATGPQPVKSDWGCGHFTCPGIWKLVRQPVTTTLLPGTH